MKLGEWGAVALTAQVQDEDGRWRTAPAGTRKPDRVRARAKVRDTDGVLRDVERYGPTGPAAARILSAALRERVSPTAAGAQVSPESLVKDVAALWLRELTEGGRLASNTVRVYTSALRHVVGTEDKPAGLANLAVREVKVSGVERLLTRVSREHGPGASKMTRSVLRNVLDLAVKHDAIPLNPVRSVGPVSAPRDSRTTARDTGRAFTAPERDAVMTYADEDSKAKARDLGDLVAFLAGTGARIGEACALRWSALDLSTGLATLGPTVVRTTGRGLVLQAAGKTKAGQRTVRLPPWLVARLMARQVEAERNEWDVVFLSQRGKLRDPSNTSHDVREVLDATGHPWATSHTFRKTVATMLDEAGASAREAANQLGHTRVSMTQDHYMSRRTVTELAAEVL